jgi:L-asparagine transporter-like permease
MRYARAYELLFGVSLFGGLFVWLMIFLTHLFFRRQNKTARVFLPAFPYLTLLGLALMIAILLSTWFVEGMAITLKAGAVWMIVVSVAYLGYRRKATLHS